MEDVDCVKGKGGGEEVLEGGRITEIGLDAGCVLGVFGFWGDGRLDYV